MTVAESTSCDTDNTSAIIGGVVAVAFMITTSLTVIVVVILVLKSRSGNYSAKTRYDHTLLHQYDYVIGFDTELQLQLQINQWSSLRSQQ